MQTPDRPAIPPPDRQLAALCRGDAAPLENWFGAASRRGLLLCLLAIASCAGLYGYTLGLWRAPQMALYVAIKLPLLIVALLLINSLINGMFGGLLGAGVGFRNSLVLGASAFAATSLILGAMAPITFFMVANAPPPDSPGAPRWHVTYLDINTALIAYAGCVGNFKAYRLLRALAPDGAAATRTYLAWLAINLFVGAQLSYILRPFFGNPKKPVEFLRPDAFNGSFYEVLIDSLTHAFGL